jgi:hypothetical protein
VGDDREPPRERYRAWKPQQPSSMPKLPPPDHQRLTGWRRRREAVMDTVGVGAVVAAYALAAPCVPLTLVWLLSLTLDGEPSVLLRRIAAVVSAVCLLDGLLLLRGARDLAADTAEHHRRRGLITFRALPSHTARLTSNGIRLSGLCIALGLAGVLAAAAAS